MRSEILSHFTARDTVLESAAMSGREIDFVVGVSGPNGLVAACTLARAGAGVHGMCGYDAACIALRRSGL